ncbi:MAG: cupredoxin domain-containing protein [Acidimicrobiales bacterium]|nr:cupredoxin domain-containing protein [Acidimicrobiales bacterium]
MTDTCKAPMTSRVLAVAFAAALAFGLAACGSSGDSGPSGGGDALPPGDVVIVADNIAWDTDELEAPADTDYTIVIDNQDQGVQHNLNIKDTDFKTELETGVSAQVLQINLPAGEYDYICDLHPNMAGTLTVS